MIATAASQKSSKSDDKKRRNPPLAKKNDVLESARVTMVMMMMMTVVSAVSTAANTDESMTRSGGVQVRDLLRLRLEAEGWEAKTYRTLDVLTRLQEANGDLVP